MSESKNLLFGLLAEQNGLIDQGQLVEAFQAWTHDKSKPLADYLVARGDLDADQRGAIEAMVSLHLRKQDGDAEKSLASIRIGASTRERLSNLGDPELTASLLRTSIQTDPDSDPTARYSVGASTSDGQRFRVLRPHARGGLGAVFVALDGELNREVALKEILERFADEPASRRRFLVEAEVTGGLEHPGIVPVYGLGTYADGRPFYAMRFIKGDSLKDAIEKFHASPTSGPLELRNLLRRFTDVCNALEYAHARGVLHRDIKPGNIIVGKYGETLVVDWGLAKSLGCSEVATEEETLVPSSASGSVETLPGAVVGTPAYMSPEQARGDLEALGPRSDVYALGATLYCLLTGRPPFSGDDVRRILQRVQDGEFTPPRAIVPTLDAALEAIVLKAMALQPEDRYPGCRALADDLDRWLADERVEAHAEPWTRTLGRWLARHRASVTGTAAAGIVALVGLAVVSAVQTAAKNELDTKNVALNMANQRISKTNAQLSAANVALDLQRRRAEEREQQAVNAVKKFRDAVTENPELKNNLVLETLRKTLLKEPLAFFRDLRERLQADQDTRPDSLGRLASAAFELGNLTDEIGDKEDAIRANREALAIRERLARENPAAAQFQIDLARSQNNLGALLSATGKPSEARAMYQQALAIRERLARENPADTPIQGELAASHNNLGNLFSATGKPGEAREAYDRALAIRERLARENPADTPIQGELAASHNNLGVLLSATGKPLEAREAFQRALAIRERLARENPTNTEFQGDLATSHIILGNLFIATGKRAEAQEAYQRALDIQGRLARENPSVTQFQSAMATIHGSFSNLFIATGKVAEAQEAYQRALDIQGRLARENPSVTQFQSDLAKSQNNLGALLSATGKPEEAREAYQKALEIRERLARENPSVTQFQRDLAGSHNNLGVLLSASGDLTRGREAWERALDIQRRLAEEHPDVVEFQNDLAVSHHNLGLLLRMAGKPEEAREAYRKALEIRERLARKDPDVTAFQDDLAASHNGLGLLLREAGEPDEAREAHLRALEIRERLAREHPESSDYASGLGGTLNNLAMIAIDAERFDEARDRLREAIGWQKKALARNPANPQYRQFMTNHLNNLLVVARRGLGDETLAIEAQQALAELQAGDPRLRAIEDRLVAVLKGAAPKDNPERLALAQRAYDTQRHGLAAKLWAEALAADPGLAADRQRQHPYNAACAAALAAAGQGTDEPALDDAAKARLRGQALGWLRGELAAWSLLVEKGPPQARALVAQTLDHWKQDGDLAGIRDAATLAAHPEAEQAAWRDLWSKVEAMRLKASGKSTAPPLELPADPFVK